MPPLKRKILLLSTGDINGAYEAIYKLAVLLHEMGHQVAMLVKYKTKPDDFIIEYQPNTNLLAQGAEKIYNRFLKPKPPQTHHEYSFYGLNETRENVNYTRILDQMSFIPEFIFTGMTINFLNSKDLKNLQALTNAHIYNITVDMNHFTGGCHFSWGCDGYTKECKDCPAIVNPKQKKIAEVNFKAKLNNAKAANFKIIAGSGLTLEQSKISRIYKDQDVFHNVNSLIDTRVLNPKNRSVAKQLFNLDSNRFYILVGAQSANDKRKGFSYLIQALKKLELILEKQIFDRLTLLVVARDINPEFETLTINKTKIDYIKDYRLLSLLYQSVDVYINSSIEDSGPMMVSEALACGTPVVGFDTGVVTNMVVNGYNGYKAENRNIEELAEGIKKIVLLSPEERQLFSQNSVKQVELYSSFEYLKNILTLILN